MKICIDPGHGGYDPGAVGQNGLQEKDVALSIGLKLRDKLQAQGIGVIITRDWDTALGDNVNADLNNRAVIANQNNVDLFVSVHCNSAADSSAHGTETYAYTPGGQGEQLARAIQAELIHAIGLTDRGVKFANYAVLRETNMSAVLVETAFISNPTEECILADDTWRERYAVAITKGICNFIGTNYKEEMQPVENTQKTEQERVAALVQELVSYKVVGDADYWTNVLMGKEAANYMYLRTAFSNALDRIKGI